MTSDRHRKTRMDKALPELFQCDIMPSPSHSSREVQVHCDQFGAEELGEFVWGKLLDRRKHEADEEGGKHFATDEND